jgi:hypothetical protein
VLANRVGKLVDDAALWARFQSIDLGLHLDDLRAKPQSNAVDVSILLWISVGTLYDCRATDAEHSLVGDLSYILLSILGPRVFDVCVSVAHKANRER